MLHESHINDVTVCEYC